MGEGGVRVFQYQRRCVGVIALALLTCVLVAACGGDEEPGGAAGRGVELVDSGRLTTCTHLPYRPFQFEQGGRIVGFDVEMLDLVAKQLGVRQEIIDTPFEGIQSGEDLNARKCDVAGAAMTITPARQMKIAFSAPYFDANQALLVRKGSGIDSLDDLRGKTLGVLSGTTGKMYAQKRAGSAGMQLKDYEDLALQLGSVKSGQIAAAINDIPVLLDYAKQNDDVEVAAQFETGEQYGFGMRKLTSEALEKVVNRVIARAKSDGTYDRLYEKWFGVKPR
jgi:polar amino acid transport system substrate-binding protein